MFVLLSDEVSFGIFWRPLPIGAFLMTYVHVTLKMSRVARDQARADASKKSL
jgi:hypothetical protein